MATRSGEERCVRSLWSVVLPLWQTSRSFTTLVSVFKLPLCFWLVYIWRARERQDALPLFLTTLSIFAIAWPLGQQEFWWTELCVLLPNNCNQCYKRFQVLQEISSVTRDSKCYQRFQVLQEISSVTRDLKIIKGHIQYLDNWSSNRQSFSQWYKRYVTKSV